MTEISSLRAFVTSSIKEFVCRLIVGLGVLPLASRPALAQFAPATGPVNSTVNFNTGSSSSQGAFHVVKSGNSLTIQRPGLSDYGYTASGTGSLQLGYAFTGPSSLLIRTVGSDSVNKSIKLVLVNMESFPSSQPPVALISSTSFSIEQPDLNVSSNTDGQVILTTLLKKDVPSTDTFDVRLIRTDSGADLCSIPSFDREPSNSISANVSGTQTSIHVERNPFPDIDKACPLPVGKLDLTPPILDFPEIVSTQHQDKTVEFENSGSDVVSVSSVANSAHFQVVNPGSFALNPGDTHIVTIRFEPGGEVGSFDEQLTIVPTPAVGASFVRARGTARAPAPAISVSPASLAFGCVDVGLAPQKSFDLVSAGELPLTVSSIVGPSDPRFTLVPPSGLSLGTPIAPLASHAFQVRFAPSHAGAAASSVQIHSNDPNRPVVTIQLTGHGNVLAAKLQIDPTVTRFDFGEVEVGYRFGKGIEVRNDGDVDLTFNAEIEYDPTEIAAGPRFGVSTDASTPGPGVHGPIGVTVPGTVPPCGGSGGSSRILRVTFDAQAPEGGPFTGKLRLFNFQGDPTLPSNHEVTIDLAGTVVVAKTVDVALVLDRSGSMNEPMAVGTKVAAVRSAARLFIDLMRADVGDRVGLVQFNNTVDVLAPMTPLDATSRATLRGQVQNPSNLSPSGSTSIAGGLHEAIQLLNDPSKDVRAAFVVSDGEDNTAYATPAGPVTLSNLQIPSGVGVHALCIGTSVNTDLGKLTAIASATGGSAMASEDVTNLGLFDIEKFFLQTATTILGGNTTLDPVARIHPGQVQTWQVELLPADKEVSFVLIYKVGALPFEIIAPDGTSYPLGTVPDGFGLSVQEPPKARVVRLQLPTDTPERYSGAWKILVRHEGKLRMEGKRGSDVAFVDEPYGEPVDYALAVSVFGNLRLLAYVSPQPLHVGDPITVTARLTEEEIPIPGAKVDVGVRFPDGATQRSIQLSDDGLHGDDGVGDGVYANHFTETLQAGHYQFAYHAVGSSAREGQFVRETFVSQYVSPPSLLQDGDSDDQPSNGGSDSKPTTTCCKWVVAATILLGLILLSIWACCARARG